jgi:hypothetical protein
MPRDWNVARRGRFIKTGAGTWTKRHPFEPSPLWKSRAAAVKSPDTGRNIFFTIWGDGRVFRSRRVSVEAGATRFETDAF